MGIYINQPGAPVELTPEQLSALANQLADILQRKSRIYRGSETVQIQEGCYKFEVFNNDSTLLMGSVQVTVNGIFYHSHNDQSDDSMGSDFYIDDKNVYFRDARCGGTIATLEDNDKISITYHEVE